jgi:hypothetical protein
MEPSRILPDLQTSLLCEDVRQESNGNFMLIGVLGLVRVPRLPVTALKLCIFNRWTAGFGQFNEEVRLIGPDQTTVVRKSNVKFALKDVNTHATNVSLFGQVEFKEAGVHYVEVLVDEVMKLRYPLNVVVAPQQQQGGQAQGGQPQPPQTPPQQS